MDQESRTFGPVEAPPFRLARLVPWLLVLGIALLFAATCWRAYSELPNTYDEYDILHPASDFLKGVDLPLGKYPPFSFLFYALFLFLFHGVGIDMLAVGRVVNLGLLLLNLFLFYRVSLSYLGRNWALMSVFLFASTPLVVFSGVFVKTEGLLISETLALMLCLNWMYEGKATVWTTIFSGVLCAVGMTTKYALMLPVMYVLATVYLYMVKKKEKRIFFHYSLFALIFIIMIVTIWPNFVEYILSWRKVNSSDPYFISSPSVLMAVDELWAFPYGRYSYAFCLLIPFSVGPLVYVLGLLSFGRWKSLPVVPVLAFVSFFLCFLIVVNLTLLRVFWIYTLLSPMVVLLAVMRLKFLFCSDSILKKRLSILLITMMLILTPSKAMSIIDFVHTFSALQIPIKIDNYSGKAIKTMAIIYNESSIANGINPDDPAGDFLKINPDIAIVSDTYLLNFCKYRRNPIYQKQCEFFHRLISGGYEYEVVTLLRDRNKYSGLFPGKDLSPTIYLVYKKGEELHFSP
ncbi:MAG: glycosyltransferase family 39 protein [Pseudomonadota bacterium]